jgi:hypothetical protein
MMMGMVVADMDTDMTTTEAEGIMKEDNPDWKAGSGD